MNRLTFFIIILITGCLITSCNDDIDIGANIVGSQPIEADFNENIIITAKTVEPIRQFIGYANRGDFERNPYVLGSLDDPNFGQTSSTIFVTPRIAITDIPDFEVSVIDSVILILPYDTLGAYGDQTAMHNVSLHRLQDPVDLVSIDTLFGDQCLEFEDVAITEVNVIPAPRDSVQIFIPSLDSIVTDVPQIRFSLDAEFWQEVLMDTLNTEGTQELVNQVKGYAIMSEPSASSMFGVNLLSTSIASIEVFYTDSVSGVYRLDISSTTSSSNSDRTQTSIKHSCFESDFSGSEVERTLGDSLAEFNYLQGLDGFNIEYDLSNVLDLDEEFVNFAVLEFFVLEDGNEPIADVRCMFLDNEGDFEDILDFGVESIRSVYFDGSLEEVEINGQTLMRYQVIMTNHIINFRNGNIASPFVYITPVGRGLPNHSIIYGPNHPTFPAKLKLITTKP
ncbi:DUF4270 domain-containing protein [Saprospiraceae bacterium]|nr:DUF4270 domain-containing protein [Saprospiraceae bacterium]